MRSAVFVFSREGYGISHSYLGMADQVKDISSEEVGILRAYHRLAEHVKGDSKTPIC